MFSNNSGIRATDREDPVCKLQRKLKCVGIMDTLAWISLFSAMALMPLLMRGLRVSESGVRPKNKVATIGLLLLSGSLLAACSSAPSIGMLSIAPGDGTVFVGAASAQGSQIRGRAIRSPKASVTVQPEDFSTATCGTLQYSAMATYSDGSVKDVTNQATWTTTNSSAATISNTGQASGVALGITYITATFNKENTGQVPLYVDALNSLAITAPLSTLPMGSATTPSTLQFAATGQFTQANGTGNSGDITTQVTWSSTNPNVATIAPGGVASSVSQGNTTIVATVCGVSNTFALTVGPPAPTSLQISPATDTIAVGSSVAYTALEMWSDGTIHPLTSPLQWTSSSKSAGVSPVTGATFGVSSGTATITATETAGNTLTGTAALTVQAAQAQFAYVANQQGGNGGSISSFTVSATNGTITPLASTPATAPQQVLLNPSGNFLYSVDSSSLVHTYQITNPGSSPATIPAGTLTLLDSAAPTPYTPVLAGAGGKNFGAIDPAGQFLYVVDRTANTLYGFQIQQFSGGATPIGSLLPITNGTPFNGAGFTFNQPTWVTTDRTGQFLYVVNAGNNTISGYQINFDGTLLPLQTSASLPPTGNGPAYGTTDSKSHMYIANVLDNTVSAYLLNSDGTWGSVGTLPVSGATAVVNVLTDPKAQYLYVVDQGGASGGQIFTFALVPPTAGSIFGPQLAPAQSVGLSPTGIAEDPGGVLLGVDNKGSNSISIFTVAGGSNSTTAGTLAPAVPSTAPTDQGPQFLVFYNSLPVPFF